MNEPDATIRPVDSGKFPGPAGVVNSMKSLKNTAQPCMSLRRRALLVHVGIAVVGVAASVYVVQAIVRTPDVWRVDTDFDSQESIVQRSKQRGQVMSLGSSIVLTSFHSSISTLCDVNISMVSIMLSLIFGNVVGYLLDNLIASPVGWERWKNSAGDKRACFRNAFASLCSPTFARYVATVLSDVFVSASFIAAFEQAVARVPDSYPNLVALFKCDEVRPFVVSEVTLFVSIVTFIVYTNETRFAWAFRTNHFPKSAKAYIEGVESLVDAKLFAKLSKFPNVWDDLGMTRVEFELLEKQDALSANGIDNTDVHQLKVAHDILSKKKSLSIDTTLFAMLNAVAALFYVNVKDSTPHLVKVIMLIAFMVIMAALITTGKVDAVTSVKDSSMQSSMLGFALFVAIALLCIMSVMLSSRKGGKKSLMVPLFLTFGIVACYTVAALMPMLSASFPIYASGIIVLVGMILFHLAYKGTRLGRRHAKKSKK